MLNVPLDQVTTSGTLLGSPLTLSSGALLGGAVGAAVARSLAHALGPRTSQHWTAAAYFVGALLCSWDWAGHHGFLLGRLVAGLGESAARSCYCLHKQPHAQECLTAQLHSCPSCSAGQIFVRSWELAHKDFLPDRCTHGLSMIDICQSVCFPQLFTQHCFFVAWACRCRCLVHNCADVPVRHCTP